MRAVLMGPPGAGKGTQARRLAAAWRVPHVSTGDLLREAVARKSPLGRKVESTLAEGKLVSDALMAELVEERLGREDCRRGFILDGYPRTQRQAEDLDALLSRSATSLERVILLDVPDEEVVLRLSGRRICSSCQAVWPRAAGSEGPQTCERCGGSLARRPDDEPETVRRRLEVYRSQTQPLIEHYRRAGRLAVIDGRGAPEEVYARLAALSQAAPR
ncbi:MAG: adenylate kinase [Gemmataceae bacterium]|nr:adenylate kinase [Gemmataceae bacterium]